jgi:hypothetical protein
MPSPSDSVVLSPLNGAALRLQLPNLAPTPRTRLSVALASANIDFPESLALLRSSPDESAQRICEVYDLLRPAEQAVCTLDHLLAACGVGLTDATKLIFAEVQRAKNLEAGIVALQEAPMVMREAAARAKNHYEALDTGDGGKIPVMTPGSHQDAKMLLQIAGIAPVPKTQVTHLTVAGNVDARIQTQTNVSVPRLEDVVLGLDKLLPKPTERESESPTESHSYNEGDR